MTPAPASTSWRKWIALSALSWLLMYVVLWLTSAPRAGN